MNQPVRTTCSSKTSRRTPAPRQASSQPLPSTKTPATPTTNNETVKMPATATTNNETVNKEQVNSSQLVDLTTNGNDGDRSALDPTTENNPKESKKLMKTNC